MPRRFAPLALFRFPDHQETEPSRTDAPLGLWWATVGIVVAVALNWLAASSSTQESPAQQRLSDQPHALVFRHVTVIDATGAPAKPDMAVVIVGDRIRTLGRTGDIEIPTDARLVNASGKFLIPGLWDMHVHLDAVFPASFPLLIANL